MSLPCPPQCHQPSMLSRRYCLVVVWRLQVPSLVLSIMVIASILGRLKMVLCVPSQKCERKTAFYLWTRRSTLVVVQLQPFACGYKITALLYLTRCNRTSCVTAVRCTSAFRAADARVRPAVTARVHPPRVYVISVNATCAVTALIRSTLVIAVSFVVVVVLGKSLVVSSLPFGL